MNQKRGTEKAVSFRSDGGSLKPREFLDTQNILIIFRVTSYGTETSLDDDEYFGLLIEGRWYYGFCT
jgi:hypothetical protein